MGTEILNSIIDFRKNAKGVSTTHTLTFKELNNLLPLLKVFKEYDINAKGNKIDLHIPLHYYKNGKLKGK